MTNDHKWTILSAHQYLLVHFITFVKASEHTGSMEFVIASVAQTVRNVLSSYSRYNSTKSWKTNEHKRFTTSRYTGLVCVHDRAARPRQLCLMHRNDTHVQYFGCRLSTIRYCHQRDLLAVLPTTSIWPWKFALIHCHEPCFCSITQKPNQKPSFQIKSQNSYPLDEIRQYAQEPANNHAHPLEAKAKHRRHIHVV